MCLNAGHMQLHVLELGWFLVELSHTNMFVEEPGSSSSSWKEREKKKKKNGYQAQSTM